MTKMRKLGLTIWLILTVYLLIVGSGSAVVGRCICSDRGCTKHEGPNCAHSHKHARVPPAHDDCSESDHGTAGDTHCHCSILPIGAANSASPALGAEASPDWMYGAAYAPCQIGSLVDSEIFCGGGRYPPGIADRRSILNSLQTVVLLI
jgi:hypothetical protein